MTTIKIRYENVYNDTHRNGIGNTARLWQHVVTSRVNMLELRILINTAGVECGAIINLSSSVLVLR